jgi:hypothetical protein
MDNTDLHAHIRSQIRPFPREARYPTGWNGDLTFTEIRETLTPKINRLMRYYRYVEVDIPDMIAHGFMRLWEELSKQPDLLAKVDHGGAAKWVMYRSGSSHYKKFYRREMYLEDLATRSGDPDDFLIDGHDHSHLIDHAQYAEAVDMRLDIEQTMRHMAEKYMHSRKHLAALYYITTSVSPDDAAELAGCGGTKKCWWLTSVVKPMRGELCEVLGMFRPRQMTWQEKLNAGQEEPLLRLIEAHEAAGKDHMVAILRGLAQHESVKTQMEQLDLPKSHVHYLRLNAHKELNKAYQGCIA